MTPHPDVLNHLRANDPAPLQRIREALTPETAALLVAGITAHEPSPRRRRVRRHVALPAAGLGLALAIGGTAAAVVALTSPKHETVTWCYLPTATGGLQSTDIAGATGDPVADCASEWQQQTGLPAPVLHAYQLKDGPIAVYPADAQAPDGARQLPGGVVQDPELLLLDETLGDHLAGLQARCFDRADAIAKTSAIVTDLGLSNWPVTTEDPSQPAAGPVCWQAAGRPAQHDVTVLPVPAGGDVPQVGELAQSLRQELVGCVSLAVARERVQQAIDSSTFSAAAKATFRVRTVHDDTTSCTIVHMNVGGSLTFTLRGR